MLSNSISDLVIVHLLRQFQCETRIIEYLLVTERHLSAIEKVTVMAIQHIFTTR